MRPLTAFLALSFLAASLAGCADDPERFPDGVSHSSSSRSMSSSSATRTFSSGPTTGPAANEPPTGTFAVAINGTNATFTLNATDPDGDDLAWELDFGDGNATNGTALPQVVNHTYAPSNSTGNATGNATGNSTGNATGNITAVFTVSDGENTVSYNVTIALGNTTGGGTAAIITGSTTAPGNPTTSAILGANGCAGYTTGENGQDCVFGEIPAGLDGKPFLFEATADGSDYELWDSCDPAMGTAVQPFGGPPSGTLPAGVGCVIMWVYGTGTGSFTFTVAG